MVTESNRMNRIVPSLANAPVDSVYPDSGPYTPYNETAAGVAIAVIPTEYRARANTRLAHGGTRHGFTLLLEYVAGVRNTVDVSAVAVKSE